MKLKSSVAADRVTTAAAHMFDIAFDGKTETVVPEPRVPPSFGWGLLVGPSGSGKTTLLRKLCKGGLLVPGKSKPLARHKADYAETGLGALAGRRALSGGEQHRVDVVGQLVSHLGVDEFTSGIDRLSACAMAAAVRRMIVQRKLRGVVFATVHDDIIPFLQPDWVWHTQKHEYLNAPHVPRYRVQNLALRDAGKVHWIPRQQLQTSALTGGGKVVVEGVKKALALPKRSSSTATAAASANAPDRVLNLVVTPCSETEASTLAQRELAIGAIARLDAPRLLATLDGCACAVIGGDIIHVSPRYRGLHLEPHIRAAVAPLRGGGGGATPAKRCTTSSASSLVPSLCSVNNGKMIPARFQYGLVVGPNGSGKSRFAKRQFPKHASLTPATWHKKKSILSHFGTDTDQAVSRIMGAGLDSVPSWLRPFHVLSNGEQMRASLARSLDTDTLVDHFTTAIDRPSAKSMAASIGRYIRKQGLYGVVFLSAHTDIIPFLKPDWVYHTDLGQLRTGSEIPGYHISLWTHPNVNESSSAWTDDTEYVLPKQRLQITGGGGQEGRDSAMATGRVGTARRPRSGDAHELVLTLQRAPRAMWSLFQQHHYLSHDLTTAARCFVATMDGQPCAFVAAAPSPGMPYSPLKADPKLAKKHAPGIPRWRESRLVVLPSHQGLGIGNLVSNAVAASFVRNGHQYYSRTAHPKMIASRRKSDEWTENMISGTVRKVTEYPGMKDGKMVRGGEKTRDDHRMGYSFEYTGTPLGGRFTHRDAARGEIACPGCTTLQMSASKCRNCQASLKSAGTRERGWHVLERR